MTYKPDYTITVLSHDKITGRRWVKDEEGNIWQQYWCDSLHMWRTVPER